MADYYPLLSRAVAGLPDPAPEARASIYDRARNALLGQLRRLEPPIPEEEIDRESIALEQAIARLETEFAPHEPALADPDAFLETLAGEEFVPLADEARPAESDVQEQEEQEGREGLRAEEEPLADEEPSLEEAPEPRPQGRDLDAPIDPPAPIAPPTDDASSQRQDDFSNDGSQEAGSGSEDGKAAAAIPAEGRKLGRASPLQPRPPMFFKVRRDKAAFEPPPPRAPGSLLRQPSLERPPAEDAPSASQSVAPQREAEPLEEAPIWGEPVNEARGFEPDAPSDPDFYAAPGDGAESEPVAEDDPAAANWTDPAPIRPRSETQRPFAPQPKPEAGAPRRLWLVGFIVALLVFLVAIAAYELRDKPEELRQKAAAPVAAPEAAANGKIVERIGGGQSRNDEAPAASAVQPVAPAPAPGTPVAPREPEASDAGAQTARRAALLVEAPDEPNKVKTFLGAVVWKVDNVSNGPNDPLSMAVHATIEIPEEKLEIAMTLQKNFDVSLPASHTMKIQFIEGADSPLGPVQQISVPQMRREDTATGDALNGVPVQITDNTFLVGLTSGAPEASNLDLLNLRGWIDVPILLSSGKIAKLTFEKGPSGDRAISDAIDAWKAQ